MDISWPECHRFLACFWSSWSLKDGKQVVEARALGEFRFLTFGFCGFLLFSRTPFLLRLQTTFGPPDSSTWGRAGRREAAMSCILKGGTGSGVVAAHSRCHRCIGSPGWCVANQEQLSQCSFMPPRLPPLASWTPGPGSCPPPCKGADFCRSLTLTELEAWRWHDTSVNFTLSLWIQFAQARSHFTVAFPFSLSCLPMPSQN